MKTFTLATGALLVAIQLNHASAIRIRADSSHGWSSLPPTQVDLQGFAFEPDSYGFEPKQAVPSRASVEASVYALAPPEPEPQRTTQWYVAPPLEEASSGEEEVESTASAASEHKKKGFWSKLGFGRTSKTSASREDLFDRKAAKLAKKEAAKRAAEEAARSKQAAKLAEKEAAKEAACQKEATKLAKKEAAKRAAAEAAAQKEAAKLAKKEAAKRAAKEAAHQKTLAKAAKQKAKIDRKEVLQYLEETKKIESAGAKAIAALQKGRFRNGKQRNKAIDDADRLEALRDERRNNGPLYQIDPKKYTKMEKEDYATWQRSQQAYENYMRLDRSGALDG